MQPSIASSSPQGHALMQAVRASLQSVSVVAHTSQG
eukprot:CAMPEP_0115884180 /NCGR_PEP_ID=MMETSP0287-20121206/29977_1 /TAXON_ID=412157 /ORGANISM="Chrysochromulina rotalis, Strain UIO044" /LENGTH=35 /DNA_ID= /DNA_START= /DNA_END= /DNA_ORIENTATION=